MASLLKRIGGLQARTPTALLSIGQILAWADAHHAATGRWPARLSGQIPQSSSGMTWETIDRALKKGLHDAPSLSLAMLLHERRGVKPGIFAERERSPVKRVRSRGAERAGYRQRLSVAQILAWADAHHAATGRWPTTRSGPIAGVSGDNWRTIGDALRNGRGGLPGGMTLTSLLMQHRGRLAPNLAPDLTVEQILSWADAYHEAHRRWPSEKCGEVAGAPEETWPGIAEALRKGRRGLPGGSSLSRLLAEQRGACSRSSRPDLSIGQILAWADAHHSAVGIWPHCGSGEVRDAPGEEWNTINEALKRGGRGLPGGSSLTRLRDEHRPHKSRDLTKQTIVVWAEAHRAKTGRWPIAKSGAVTGAPGETWNSIDQALRYGHRGLRGGLSLARLLRRRPRPGLTLDQVRAWAKVHHAATGQRPGSHSGAIHGTPGENWKSIDSALRRGYRGLPSGLTLSRLLGPAASRRPRLTLDQVLAWGEAHHAATGRWPTQRSGAIPSAPRETWKKINTNLRFGNRGLPSGMSVVRLFAGRPVPAVTGRRRKTPSRSG